MQKQFALLIIGLLFVAGHALATPKPVHIKNSTWSKSSLHKFCNTVGGTFTIEDDGKYSCTTNEGINTNCKKNGKCEDVCSTSKCGNDGKLTKNNNKIKPVTANGGLANSSKIPAAGSETTVGLNSGRGPQGNAAPGGPPIIAAPSRPAPSLGGGAFGAPTSKPNTESMNGTMSSPAGVAGRRLP
jgi:hypothetical protein